MACTCPPFFAHILMHKAESLTLTMDKDGADKRIAYVISALSKHVLIFACVNFLEQDFQARTWREAGSN